MDISHLCLLGTGKIEIWVREYFVVPYIHHPAGSQLAIIFLPPVVPDHH
jgi:hypothetical protein